MRLSLPEIPKGTMRQIHVVSPNAFKFVAVRRSGHTKREGSILVYLPPKPGGPPRPGKAPGGPPKPGGGPPKGGAPAGG